MKTAVITRHAITNYGSLLQAIATQKVIESLGHECKIIDYIRDDESYKHHELTLLKKKTEWNNNPIKRLVYLLLRQPESLMAGRRFEKEQKKYLNLTKRYTTPEELRLALPEADVYITGSDQVWGPVANGIYDSSYCLSFTNDKDKRIAYAASFGHCDMTAELRDYYIKWLSRYKHIAVREDSAVSILNEWGIEANQVLDPTLLLNASFWSKFAKGKERKPYVLVYQIHNDKRLGEYAQKTAKAMGLPLIRISASLHQISREGNLVWCPKISEFLGYIKNAECMITDSFHGTAFAINFNTQFVEVLPNNNTGTRNMSILKLTGLEDRILRDLNDISLAQRKIDYTIANSMLAEKRQESIDILKAMIKN